MAATRSTSSSVLLVYGLGAALMLAPVLAGWRSSDS